MKSVGQISLENIFFMTKQSLGNAALKGQKNIKFLGKLSVIPYSFKRTFYKISSETFAKDPDFQNLVFRRKNPKPASSLEVIF